MKEHQKSEPSRILSCRGLIALALTLASVAFGAAQADTNSPVWRVPDDAAWELISGRGETSWREDRWVWDAAPPDRGGTVGVRLPVNLADFDEIRFEYKPTHGPVSLQVTADGYPDALLSRNWYDKHPQRQNEWNAVAFDLNLDDDGLPTRRPDGHDLWLHFRYSPATENDDPTRRTVEFRNIRLVRHPVRWTVDYFRTRTRIREDGACEISYPIALRNRTDRVVDVSLELRREPPRTGEPLFAYPPDADRRWRLHPNPSADNQDMRDRWGGGWGELDGDAVPAWITFTAPAGGLAERSPLWTEIVWPELRVEGFDEPILPLSSSRLDPWFLVVPPAEHFQPGLEATPAALERAIRRNAENPQFQGVLDSFIAQAERTLAIPRITYELPEDAHEAAGTDWRARIRPQFRDFWFVPRQNYRDTRSVLGMTAVEANIVNGQRALTLARAYALTGREEFRQGALEVFNAYGDQYPLWEPMRESSTAFRARSAINSLMVGFRYPNFFVGYDYLRHSLTLDEQRHIEDRFLLPVARVADGHVNDYNNQLTVHNLVPFYYAMSIGNWPLAMRYVEGPRGLYAMRKHGFDVDGMGMEHDMGYHWNSLDPMIQQLISLDFYGYDSSELDMDSPMRLPILLAADPRHFQGGFSHRYEWAYAHHGDPIFALPNDLRNTAGKRSVDGLLFGAEVLPALDDIALEPAHLKNAGYVTVRHLPDSETLRAISVNYGAPRNRLHIDLLSVIVSENGKSLFGMMGQGSELGRRGWYSTMADTLLVVNGRDQVVGRGQLVNLHQGDDWAGLEVATRPEMPLYEPNVTYHRLVVSLPDAVVLLDRAFSPEPVEFQWTCYPGTNLHTPDDWGDADHPNLQTGVVNAGPLSPARRRWRAAADPARTLMLEASVRDEERPLPVKVLVEPAQRPYAFETPGSPAGTWVDTLLLHGQNQDKANWAAVLSRSDGEVVAEWLRVADADGTPLPIGRAAALRVTTPGGVWIVASAAAGGISVEGYPLENGWLIRQISRQER